MSKHKDKVRVTTYCILTKLGHRTKTVVPFESN